MKVKKILLAIFTLSLFMISCENNDVNDESSTENVKINLTIQGAQAAAGLRSVDNNPVDEDNVINDLIVFVVRADNTFDISPQYYTSGDLVAGTTVPTITATTKATSVFVMTNTGQFTTGAFKNVTNLASLNDIVMSLDGNANTASNCKSTNVWMEGNAILQANGVDGDGTTKKKATVTLNYLPAKVYVKISNQMTNYDQGNVILDGVSVVNGGTWTRFTMNSGDYKPTPAQIPSGKPFFYNGIDINPGLYMDQPAVGNYVTNAIYKWAPAGSFPMLPAVSIPATANMATTEGFYIFPTITTNKTYVTIYGRYDTSQGRSASNLTDPNYFWSFSFAGTDGLASALVSGDKYVINITLKGNANTGGGGTTDPTEEVEGSYVDITVVKAEWVPYIVDKEIK